MNRSLIFLLAIAALSFSAHAQESENSKNSAANGKDEETVSEIKLDDADRAEMKKGAKLVMSGAQGFFGALRSAVDQVHRERADKEKVNSKKPVKKDKPLSP